MVGIVLVKLTGWLVLDPLIAIAVAINITLTGVHLFRETASGLMDHSLPEAELQSLEAHLAQRSGNGIDFHALRTRVAGSRRFISLHVLVPGGWSVKEGHDYCETIEREIAGLVPESHVFTHLEPIEDPLSWQDRNFRWDNETEPL